MTLIGKIKNSVREEVIWKSMWPFLEHEMYVTAHLGFPPPEVLWPLKGISNLSRLYLIILSA